MRAVLVAAVAALALIAAPTATAASADLGGGSTTLKLDAGLAKALTGAGVAVGPVSPATAKKGGRVAFPITGGELNPKTAAGVINHSGGLSIKAGKTTVSLTNFRIKVGKRVSLSARVGNARLKILDLSLAKAKVSRNGFGLKVRGVRAYLSRGAAGALNKAFKTHLFRRGTRVGTASVSATFAEAILAKGSTTLALDAGAAAALNSLGVSAAPVSPAKARSAGLAFPITGGKVNLSTLVGKITHSGGIALTKGSTRVELTRFTINVDSAPDLTARVGSSRVSILDLDVSGLTRSVSGRTITLGGVKATLTQAAADALNGAFATTAFTKGLVLGTATVKATAR